MIATRVRDGDRRERVIRVTATAMNSRSAQVVLTLLVPQRHILGEASTSAATLRGELNGFRSLLENTP